MVNILESRPVFIPLDLWNAILNNRPANKPIDDCKLSFDLKLIFIKLVF
jgi:hypothetical protein